MVDCFLGNSGEEIVVFIFDAKCGDKSHCAKDTVEYIAEKRKPRSEYMNAQCDVGLGCLNMA